MQEHVPKRIYQPNLTGLVSKLIVYNVGQNMHEKGRYDFFNTLSLSSTIELSFTTEPEVADAHQRDIYHG